MIPGNLTLVTGSKNCISPGETNGKKKSRKQTQEKTTTRPKIKKAGTRDEQNGIPGDPARFNAVTLLPSVSMGVTGSSGRSICGLVSHDVVGVVTTLGVFVKPTLSLDAHVAGVGCLVNQ